MPPNALRYAAVGTLAGLFSALFGVGGGTVLVPLLILWFGFGERAATATSLAAIVIIAAFAVVGHGAYGNVDIARGFEVGLPAIGGVILGTGVQQRIDERALSLIFAALLVAVAIGLVLD